MTKIEVGQVNLTVYRPAELSKKELAEVVKWLRERIDYLEKNSEMMGDRFSARKTTIKDINE